MREMNAIVAGRVVPTSMYVDKTLLATGERKMAISFIHEAASTLSLEIEDDIGERVALENIIVDFECAGAYLARSGVNL